MGFTFIYFLHETLIKNNLLKQNIKKVLLNLTPVSTEKKISKNQPPLTFEQNFQKKIE
jgi:hypothetical protein